MVDKRKINISKSKYMLHKLQEYGFNECLSNYLLLSWSSTILDDSLLVVGSFVYMAKLIKILYDMDKKDGEFINNIVDYEALKSKEYLELKEKYNLYVKKLAEVLKQIGFDDSMDLGIFLTIMLYEGALSSTDDYEYKHDNVDSDIYYHGTLGARVLSGYGVCRNAAALFRDIYKEMGYDANYLVVKLHKYLPSQSHAVVMVSADEGNYIIDPTWKTIGLIDDNYSKTKEIINITGFDIDCKYYFKGYYDDNNYYNRIDTDYFLNREKNREISKEELLEKYINMYMLFKKNDSYFDDESESFNEKNSDLINDICQREQQLTLVKK